MKFKIRPKKNQKQINISERPASVERDDGLNILEVEQQNTGIRDEKTKRKEIPSQVEFDLEVGHLH